MISLHETAGAERWSAKA